VIAALAASVDVLHALLMAFWVIGMPLLFVHRWPRLTCVYSAFAMAFIAVNVLSQWVLGECILTTLARFLWTHSSGVPPQDAQEWFTVRFSDWIFHMAPSHGAVQRATELLIAVCSIGAFYSARRLMGGHVLSKFHRRSTLAP
jgi:hypothetical protein